MATQCPFCGCDPYHYVDNGVGMEAVAVNCCDLGVVYFDRRETPATVTIEWKDFERFAEVFLAMRTLGMHPND